MWRFFSRAVARLARLLARHARGVRDPERAEDTQGSVNDVPLQEEKGDQSMRPKSGEPIEQLVLEGDVAFFNLLYGGPGGRTECQERTSVAAFSQEFRQRCLLTQSWDLGLVPSGLAVRGVHHQNGIVVILIEVAPGPRTMQWLADDSPARFGPSATYQDVHISLPWQYFFIAMTPEGRLCELSSVYFRNEQLKSTSDPLCECHFFNCSVDAYGAHCWICTGGLPNMKGRNQSCFDFAESVIEKFLFGGFNESSEHYEGNSFWGENRTRISDRRLRTIAAWHAATKEDAHFATTVSWVPAPHTAQSVFMELTDDARRHVPRMTAELVLLVTSCAQAERKGARRQRKEHQL